MAPGHHSVHQREYTTSGYLPVTPHQTHTSDGWKNTISVSHHPNEDRSCCFGETTDHTYHHRTIPIPGPGCLLWPPPHGMQIPAAGTCPRGHTHDESPPHHSVPPCGSAFPFRGPSLFSGSFTPAPVHGRKRYRSSVPERKQKQKQKNGRAPADRFSPGVHLR